MNKIKRISLLAFFSLCLFSMNTALADCTSPAAVEGTIERFDSDNTFRYCNGTIWQYLPRVTAYKLSISGSYGTVDTYFNNNSICLAGDVLIANASASDGTWSWCLRYTP